MAWKTFWSRLTASQREAAAFAFWRNREQDAEIYAGAVEELARDLRFRTKFIRRLPDEKRAKYMAGQGRPGPDTIRAALECLMLERRAMLVRFLNALGMPHDEGVYDGAGAGCPEILPEVLASAVTILRAEFPKDDVDLYLAFLLEHEPELWRTLSAVLSGDARSNARPAQAEEEDPESGSAAATGPDSPGFTTLDRVLVKAIIETVAGVEGALDHDQLEDLIDEVVHLNSDRRSSYFHRGYKGELLGEEIRFDFPEANPDRCAWLMVGALHAAARRDDHERVLALLEEHPRVTSSMKAGRPRSGPETIRIIFTALVETGRISELPRWLDHEAVAAGGQRLWKQIAWEAGGLIRQRRGEEAEPVIDHAITAVELLATRTESTPEMEFVLGELNRRKAHCLRLRSDFEGAAQLLSSLLEGATEYREAMILADLGLVRTGFRSLSDVRLPRERSAFADAAFSLGKGETFFARSAAARRPRGGHGEYCLGVLHLARGDRGRALPLLERAVAEMQKHPETYKEVELPRARLYLGACLADTLDPARASYAAECIESGVSRLGEEALPFLSEALSALDAVAPTVAVDLTRTLLGRLGNPLVDVAVGTGVIARVAELRRVLAERAAAEGRSDRERRADLLALLEAAKKADDAELGGTALDGLEALALEGTGENELFDLLDSDEYRGFVWSREDALHLRVRIHEARGEFEQAAALLRMLAHGILTKQDRRDWLLEAEDLAELIASYGRKDEALISRIEHARGEASQPASPAARGRLVVLGGNETQARYDMEIKEEVEARWPTVELVIHHPAWSSNWGRQMERWDYDIRAAGAVVLMRFVRTQFGRTVRRVCGEEGIPWVACTGHGKGSILRAVEAAVGCL